MEAQLKLIDLDQIDINEANPRKRMDEESLKELAASVASVGVIQPVVLTTRDGRNLLVTGERRVRAARMADLKEIPAVVRDLTDRQILEAMLIENLQREDLAPLEEADALNRLIQQYSWKQKDLAERIGRSQPWISKRISLLGLPQEAQQALYSGVITIQDAVELCRLRKWPDLILEALNNPGWSIKSQVETLLKRVQRQIAEEKVLAKLEAEGKRIYRGRYCTMYWSGTTYPALALEEDQEEEHIRENRSCLAYSVDYNLDPIPVCTDRSHWVDEMHAHEIESREREEMERKAKEQLRLEADYEAIRSITGSVEEIEEWMRREATNYARQKRIQEAACRVFGWKDGRRFDRKRLPNEIKKAKKRELRRLWLVTLALHQLTYGWSESQVITMIQDLGAVEEGSDE